MTVRRRLHGAVRIASVVGGSLLAASACSSSSNGLPPPSSTSSTVPVATTAEQDLSTVVLDTVPGRTTTTLLAVGTVVLSGTVTGPDGPVVGAIVRVERLVGSGVQIVDVVSGPDGTWMAERLPGGRVRVRAFLTPTLVTAEPTLLYVADGSNERVDLVVDEHAGRTAVGATTPQQPMVGRSLNLAVRVVDRFVDDAGVGRSTPVAGLAVRVDASGWVADDDPVGTTDGDGVAVFGFRCDRAGEVRAMVTLDTGERIELAVPPCTSVAASSTTTSRPGATSSTREAGR